METKNERNAWIVWAYPTPTNPRNHTPRQPCVPDPSRAMLLGVISAASHKEAVREAWTTLDGFGLEELGYGYVIVSTRANEHWGGPPPADLPMYRRPTDNFDPNFPSAEGGAAHDLLRVGDFPKLISAYVGHVQTTAMTHESASWNAYCEEQGIDPRTRAQERQGFEAGWRGAYLDSIAMLLATAKEMQ